LECSRAGAPIEEFRTVDCIHCNPCMAKTRSEGKATGASADLPSTRPRFCLVFTRGMSSKSKSAPALYPGQVCRWRRGSADRARRRGAVAHVRPSDEVKTLQAWRARPRRRWPGDAETACLKCVGSGDNPRRMLDSVIATDARYALELAGVGYAVLSMWR
jgi:hypothetical protein